VTRGKHARHRQLTGSIVIAARAIGAGSAIPVLRMRSATDLSPNRIRPVLHAREIGPSLSLALPANRTMRQPSLSSLLIPFQPGDSACAQRGRAPESRGRMARREALKINPTVGQVDLWLIRAGQSGAGGQCDGKLTIASSPRTPPPSRSSRRDFPGNPSVRMVGAKYPLSHGQQSGIHVPGPGRVPCLTCPADNAVTDMQRVSML